jgi:hypothetical protein
MLLLDLVVTASKAGVTVAIDKFYSFSFKNMNAFYPDRYESELIYWERLF